MFGSENYNRGEFDEGAEIGIIHSLATLGKKKMAHTVSQSNNSASTGGDVNGFVIAGPKSINPGESGGRALGVMGSSDLLNNRPRRKSSSFQASYLVSDDYSIDQRQKLSSKVLALNENTIRVNASKSLHQNSISTPVTFQSHDHLASNNILGVPRGNESVFENRDDSMIAQSPLPPEQNSHYSRVSRTSRIGQSSKITTTRLEPNLLHSEVLPTETHSPPEQRSNRNFLTPSIVVTPTGSRTEPLQSDSWLKGRNPEITAPVNPNTYSQLGQTSTSPPGYTPLNQYSQLVKQSTHSQTDQKPVANNQPQHNYQIDPNSAVTQAPKPEYLQNQQQQLTSNLPVTRPEHEAAKARAFNLYKYVGKKQYMSLATEPTSPDQYIPEMKMSLNRARYITTYFSEQLKARPPWRLPPASSNWWQFGSSNEFPQNPRRGIIALDLDETLIHAESLEPHVANNEQIFRSKDYDDRINVLLPNGEWQEFGVRIRPYAKEFLQVLYKMGYTLVVYTASIKNYADQIVKILDPNGSLIKSTMHREDCLHVGGVYIKELARILNSDPNDTIIVDNYVHSFAINLGLGFPIKPYYQGRDDFELELLADFIRENAPKYANLAQFMKEALGFEEFFNFLERVNVT